MAGGKVYIVDFEKFLNNIMIDFSFLAPYFGYTWERDVFKAFAYVQYKPRNELPDHPFHTSFEEHMFEGEAYRRAALATFHKMHHHLPIHLDDLIGSWTTWCRGSISLLQSQSLGWSIFSREWD